MLLNKTQKLLLDILKEFGGIRQQHADQLLSKAYTWFQPEHTYPILANAGQIYVQDGMIYPQNRRYDVDLLHALDVMLMLAPGDIRHYQRGVYPFALTFFKERNERLWRYDICPVKTGMEGPICAALEGINAKYRVVVFMPEAEKPHYIPVLCESYIALSEQGTYRFFKNTEQKESD